MPNYIRPKIAGARIFFSVNLADRTSTLLVDKIAHLRNAVRTAREARPFEIDAWVVLPEHLHCIWTLPDGDADYSTRWKEIKCAFTKSVGVTEPRSHSKQAKGEAGLWQRRFWDHHIRDDADFVHHMRYCWVNPIKHGYVTDPAAWPYSSVHRDLRTGRIDQSDVGWVLTHR